MNFDIFKGSEVAELIKQNERLKEIISHLSK